MGGRSSLLKVPLLSGGRETDSIWSSISLDSPPLDVGESTGISGETALRNLEWEGSIIRSSQIQTNSLCIFW